MAKTIESVGYTDDVGRGFATRGTAYDAVGGMSFTLENRRPICTVAVEPSDESRWCFVIARPGIRDGGGTRIERSCSCVAGLRFGSGDIVGGV